MLAKIKRITVAGRCIIIGIVKEFGTCMFDDALSELGFWNNFVIFLSWRLALRLTPK